LPQDVQLIEDLTEYLQAGGNITAGNAGTRGDRLVILTSNKVSTASIQGVPMKLRVITVKQGGAAALVQVDI
tara:strand:+ start:1273 stop:1488 length:216 start_codon:yes stop_codon:yes gene_type:complete